MLASIHKTVFQFNSKVRPFRPAANGTVWGSNLISLFGKFQSHDMERVTLVMKFRSGDRSQVKHAAVAVEWKHLCFCQFSHGITLPIAYEFRFYNNKLYYIIDGFGRLLGKVVEWFCAMTLSKTYCGQQDRPTDLFGRRLWVAASYYGSATAKMASWWFRN